jgi:hypothetical protein
MQQESLMSLFADTIVIEDDDDEKSSRDFGEKMSLLHAALDRKERQKRKRVSFQSPEGQDIPDRFSLDYFLLTADPKTLSMNDIGVCASQLLRKGTSIRGAREQLAARMEEFQNAENDFNTFSLQRHCGKHGQGVHEHQLLSTRIDLSLRRVQDAQLQVFCALLSNFLCNQIQEPKSTDQDIKFQSY